VKICGRKTPVSYFLYDLPLQSHMCDRFETGRTTDRTTVLRPRLIYDCV